MIIFQLLIILFYCLPLKIKCFEFLEEVPFLFLQEGGSVVTALVDLLQVLLTYCRSQLSTLTGTTVLHCLSGLG